MVGQKRGDTILASRRTMIAYDGEGNWRCDNGWTLLNHVIRQMNARKLSTGPITSSYQWPTQRPTVRLSHAQPAQPSSDRFDGSDENYLIGYLATVSTSVYVILCWTSRTPKHADTVSHRSSFMNAWLESRRCHPQKWRCEISAPFGTGRKIKIRISIWKCDKNFHYNSDDLFNKIIRL